MSHGYFGLVKSAVLALFCLGTPLLSDAQGFGQNCSTAPSQMDKVEVIPTVSPAGRDFSLVRARLPC